MHDHLKERLVSRSLNQFLLGNIMILSYTQPDKSLVINLVIGTKVIWFCFSNENKIQYFNIEQCSGKWIRKFYNSCKTISRKNLLPEIEKKLQPNFLLKILGKKFPVYQITNTEKKQLEVLDVIFKKLDNYQTSFIE